MMMHPAQNRVMMPTAILAPICSVRIRTVPQQLTMRPMAARWHCQANLTSLFVYLTEKQPPCVAGLQQLRTGATTKL